jgi:hypothetical protein
VRKIERIAQLLSHNARTSMRECALKFRAAQRRGDEVFAEKWIAHAKTFRELSRGYLEAA